MSGPAPLAPAAPAAGPVEIIEGDIRRVCGAFRLEPAGRSGIVRGAVGTRALGRFDTALVSLDVAHVDRTSRDIRADPGEFMFLLVQDEGLAAIRQGSLDVTLRPGEMALVDSTRPLRFAYGGRFSHQISLHLPRDEMLRRFGPAVAQGAGFLREDPLWLPMRAVIERMLEAPPAEGCGLSEALLGLMGAWFAARASGEAGDTVAARALRLIERHADEPEFGPGVLADRLGVSARLLQRHFQPLGESPGARLMAVRLDRARARLAARGHRGVAEIAFASGFNDLSHFYRAYRRRFGTAPGAALLSHSAKPRDA